MPVLIRTARAADADDVARLTGHLGYDVAPADVEASLSRILARTDQQFLVAEIDGRPVGWLHLGVVEYIETGPFAVINGLVVDSGCRGQGIGRLLLEWAEEWSTRQGVSIVRLWSTTSRERAHRFYERLGYTKIKTQYSFAKSVGANRQQDFTALIPRVDPEP